MYSLKVIEKKLYQWNTDVYVEVIAPEGMEIHHVDFSHNINGPAIRRSVIVEDGIVKAKVPNKLLQSPNNIRVWFVSNGQTVYGNILAVAPKAKHDGYVLPDDGDEVLNYETLAERISHIEKLLKNDWFEVDGEEEFIEAQITVNYEEKTVSIETIGIDVDYDGQGSVILNSDNLVVDYSEGNVSIEIG